MEKESIDEAYAKAVCKWNTEEKCDQEFNAYQAKAHTFAFYPKCYVKVPESENPACVSWVYPVLGLEGEAGEVADKFKKIIRDKGGMLTNEDEKEILKEMGDVLWYLAETAGALGVSLSKVAEININKLTSRKERDELSGSGDNR